MSVNLKPTSIIVADLGLDDNGEIMKFITNECARKMRNYVPKREGTLRRTVKVYNNSIIYSQPYAKYQYYGIRIDGTHKVMKYTTQGTGPYWDKKMWAVDGDSIIRAAQSKINGGK